MAEPLFNQKITPFRVVVLITTVFTVGVLLGGAISLYATPNESQSVAKNSEPSTDPTEEKRFRYVNEGEFEVEGSYRHLPPVEQITQALRKRQPIYFLGFPMDQIPTDNWLLGELIHAQKPDYFIEAGTRHGGSALYYAAMLEMVNPDGKVLTIDINEEQISPAALVHPIWQKHITFFWGSSVSREVHAQLAKEIGSDKKVMITLDTLHAPRHVAAELKLFSKYVQPGGYLILQDTFYKGLDEVVDNFLKAHPNWERDRRLDNRYLFTKYRGGYLRRRE